MTEKKFVRPKMSRMCLFFVVLGDFLDEQIARVIQHDVVESDDELETETPETPVRPSLPRYELPKVPEGYVMSEEATRDILA